MGLNETKLEQNQVRKQTIRIKQEVKSIATEGIQDNDKNQENQKEIPRKCKRSIKPFFLQHVRKTGHWKLSQK